MLNHTQGSIYQAAAVALWGRAVAKGIKTFNSSRARLRHSEALNSVPRHPKYQKVFSQKEHWTFIPKHRLKLHIYKKHSVLKAGRGGESGREKAKKKMENEERREKNKGDYLKSDSGSGQHVVTSPV